MTQRPPRLGKPSVGAAAVVGALLVGGALLVEVWYFYLWMASNLAGADPANWGNGAPIALVPALGGGGLALVLSRARARHVSGRSVLGRVAWAVWGCLLLSVAAFFVLGFLGRVY